MLRRTMVAVVAVTLAMIAGTALAQPQCVVGVYADPAGLSTIASPTHSGGQISDTFSVYTILFAEDFANAVAWSLYIQGLGTDVFVVSRTDYGNFTDVQPQGFRMGLGNCIIGFNHHPILLMRHDLATLTINPRLVQVGPNALESSQSPIYSNCVQQLTPCAAGVLGINGPPIPNDSASWGSVKALYGN
jgi:hypothetical protein